MKRIYSPVEYILSCFTPFVKYHKVKLENKIENFYFCTDINKYVQPNQSIS